MTAKELLQAGEWEIVDTRSPLVVASTCGVPAGEVAMRLAQVGLRGVEGDGGCVWYYRHGGTVAEAQELASDAAKDAGLPWLTWRGAVS